MLGIILSLPVSLLLVFWIIRIKKDNPFPKYAVIKLLLFGVLSAILVSVFTIGFGLVRLFMTFGFENIVNLFNDPSSKSAIEIINNIKQASQASKENMSYLKLLINTFIIVGLAEEVFKFLCCKIAIRKTKIVNTWLDMVLVMALVGVGFQIIEDITYLSGSIISTIMRAITPFHFCFGIIMGYLYGLGKVKNNKIYTILSILVPSIIHTVYDASLMALEIDEMFIILVFFVMIGMFVMLFIEIRKVNKWNKTKQLDVLINNDI